MGADFLRFQWLTTLSLAVVQKVGPVTIKRGGKMNATIPTNTRPWTLNIFSRLRLPSRKLVRYFKQTLSITLTVCVNALAGGQLPKAAETLSVTWLKSAKSPSPTHMEGLPQKGIVASEWHKPQQGWLYVMDYDSVHAGSPGQVLLVDPDSAQIVGRLIVGSAPEIALSPDGSHLYVASMLDAGDMLSVIDTTTGATLGSVPINNRAQYTSMPDTPVIAVSPDGLWVYILEMRTISRLHDEFTLASFDVAKNAFLPEAPVLPGCVSGLLFPSPNGQQVQVVCRGSNDVHSLLQTPSRLQTIPPPSPLRSVGADLTPATGALSSTGNLLVIG